MLVVLGRAGVRVWFVGIVVVVFELVVVLDRVRWGAVFLVV